MKSNVLPLLAIVMAAMMGAFFGCNLLKDKAEDEDKDKTGMGFEDDSKLELKPVHAEDGQDTQALDTDCGTTTVNDELDRAEFDQDEVNIFSVQLEFVEVRYIDATWEPDAQMTCVLTMSGDLGTVTVIEHNVDKSSSDWSEVNVNSDAEQFINYYLENNNRDSEFSYCVSCTDADSYSVDYYINIGVEIQGELSG